MSPYILSEEQYNNLRVFILAALDANRASNFGIAREKTAEAYVLLLAVKSQQGVGQ